MLLSLIWDLYQLNIEQTKFLKLVQNKLLFKEAIIIKFAKHCNKLTVFLLVIPFQSYPTLQTFLVAILA